MILKMEFLNIEFLWLLIAVPLLVLWFLIFEMNFSFAYVFWGLLIINWIFGIFVFLLSYLR